MVVIRWEQTVNPKKGSFRDRRFENGGQCHRTYPSHILGSAPPPPPSTSIKVYENLVKKYRIALWWPKDLDFSNFRVLGYLVQFSGYCFQFSGYFFIFRVIVFNFRVIIFKVRVIIFKVRVTIFEFRVTFFQFFGLFFQVSGYFLKSRVIISNLKVSIFEWSVVLRLNIEQIGWKLVSPKRRPLHFLWNNPTSITSW